MSIYYSSNHLKPNPAKTQICCFHLRNTDAKRKLDVTWNGLELDHYTNVIYLGVILDRTLSFKQHALNTKAKINTRNNLLRKLTNSCLYALAGIAPPHIRRKVAANADRCLQEDDSRHGQRPAKHMLPSSNSFIDSTEALNTSKQDARITLWVEEWNALGERSTEWRDRGIIPNEHLASSTDEPWSTWRSLNRLRVQKGRCRAMMKMWKLSHTDVCDCGERQTMSHLMTCGDAPNARGPTWLFQPMPVSTVPNTGRNQSLTVDFQDSTILSA